MAMETVRSALEHDFTGPDFSVEATVASGTNGVINVGPYRVPSFEGVNAEAVTAYVDAGTNTIDVAVTLQHGTSADGPWFDVADAEDITTSAAFQSVHFGGSHVRLNLNIGTALPGAVTVRFVAK